MSAPVVVGVALDERDAAPIALGRSLSALVSRDLAPAHVYPYEPMASPTPEYEATLRQDGAERLGRLAAGIEHGTCVTEHVYGRVSAARGLHELAEHLEAFTLVVGSSHQGPVGRVLAGGIGERLLHGAPCPVAIATAGYTKSSLAGPRIGVAFDGGPESHAALEAAIFLARLCGGTVSTFTAMEPVETAAAMTTPGWTVPALYVQAHRRHAEEAAHAARDRVPEEMRGETQTITGHPVEILRSASAELDVLICGSRGYGPLRAVLAGSVSRALAHGCECPLLVIPRGANPRLAADAPHQATAIN